MGYHPSVDLDYIQQSLIDKQRLDPDNIVKSGSTTAFVLNGDKPIHKRTVYVRELEPGQVCFEQAIGIAANNGFLSLLLDWLEKNRQWREGEYFEK